MHPQNRFNVRKLHQSLYLDTWKCRWTFNHYYCILNAAYKMYKNSFTLQYTISNFPIVDILVFQEFTPHFTNKPMFKLIRHTFIKCLHSLNTLRFDWHWLRRNFHICKAEHFTLLFRPSLSLSLSLEKYKKEGKTNFFNIYNVCN